jgi:hypothetical protein
MSRKVAVPLRQDAAELGTRGDAELGEDLAQVIPGGARADEQAGADLGVGQPLASELGDLGLLDRQFAVAADTALSCSCLPAGWPVTERLRAGEIDDDEGRRLVRIVRRARGRVVTGRRRRRCC